MLPHAPTRNQKGKRSEVRRRRFGVQIAQVRAAVRGGAVARPCTLYDASNQRGGVRVVGVLVNYTEHVAKNSL